MKRLPFLLTLISLASLCGLLLDRRDERLMRSAAGESQAERDGR